MVEVISQCPTYYGRKNKLGSAVEMMRRFKEDTAPLGSKKIADHPGMIARGIFVEEERPEYSSSYLAYVEKHQEEKPSSEK